MSNKFIGSSSGLTLVSGSGKTRITPTYNSGIMPEGIKLAALADTIPDGYGVELITDGSMSSASNWTGLSATLSIVSGRLRVTNSTTATGAAYQTITTVAGRRYTAKVDVTAGTCANGTVYVGTSAGDSSLGTSDTDIGVISVDFWATGTTTYIHLENGCSTSGNYADYDTASVKVSEFVGVDETTELVTNGTFTSDISGWTDASTGTGSISWNASGYLDLVSVDASNRGIAKQTVSGLTIGKTYSYSFERKDANSLTAYLGTTDGGSQIFNGSPLASGVNTIEFVATTDTVYITMTGAASAITTSLDNISVKQTGNLIVNPNFDVDTSGWTGNNATLSATSGVLRLTAIANGAMYAYPANGISLEVGKTYVANVDLVAETSSGTLYFRVGSTIGGAEMLPSQTILSGNSYTYSFIATATTGYPQVLSGSGTLLGETADFDNISVRLADPDRSVNNDGLEIHGTLTKTAVSSGAELVAYSGFSANNYLEQPYNSVLDFGTGDFYVMGWVKNTNLALAQTLISRAVSGNAAFYIKSTSAANIDIYVGNTLHSSGIALDNSMFAHITLLRVNGVVHLFKNGADAYSVANTNSVDSSSNDSTYIGVYVGGTSPSTASSLALWRIGAGAPTAEQITEIYEAEKPLFQENAKCTLQSSSSDVKALAYDDTTDILTVCTADHVTKFNGLKVVDDEARVATSVSTTDGRELYGA